MAEEDKSVESGGMKNEVEKDKLVKSGRGSEEWGSCLPWLSTTEAELFSVHGQLRTIDLVVAKTRQISAMPRRQQSKQRRLPFLATTEAALTTSGSGFISSTNLVAVTGEVVTGTTPAFH